MGRLWLTGCEVDLGTGDVVRGGVREELTLRERELLAYLVDHPGRDVPRDELLVRVWDYAPTARTRAIDNMVRKLRAKVELDRDRPRHVLTVPGGYRFEPAVDLGPDDRYGDSFVGREGLLAEGAARLEGSLPVLLTGPPGIGKSRLGWEILRRWSRASGRWWVPAGWVQTADDLAAAVANALELPLDTVASGSDVVDRIGLALAGRGGRLLLIDNLDQARPEVGDPIGRWLAAVPDLRILGTGRTPLAGWSPLPVPSLGPELAQALFLDRARRVRPTVTTDPAIVALCEELDGVPLALEIAAARTAVLPASSILDRLRRDLDVLRSPDGNSLDRVLAWSWDLLSESQRSVLGQCAVFEGPFDASGAERVVQAPDRVPVLDHLHDLVERSLVHRIGSELRLLVPIRVFVAARTADLGTVRDRHLTWLLDQLVASPYEVAARARADLQAAFEHARVTSPDRAAELASELATADFRAPLDRRIDNLRRALVSGASPEARTRARMSLTAILARLGSHTEAEAQVQAAWRDAEQAGTGRARAHARAGQAFAALAAGRASEAVEGFRDMLGSPDLPDLLRINAILHLAAAHKRLGDLAAAHGEYREAVDAARSTRLPRLLVAALAGLNATASRLGWTSNAEVWWDEADAACAVARDDFARVMLAIDRAVVRIDAGRTDEAVAVLVPAHQIAVEVGDRFLLGCTLSPLGMAWVEQGRLTDAIAALTEALSHFVVLDSRSLLVSGRINLGVARVLAGDRGGLGLLREAATLGVVSPSEQAVGAAFWALADRGSTEARTAFDSLAGGSREPLLLALRGLVERGDRDAVQKLAGSTLYARVALAVDGARP